MIRLTTLTSVLTEAAEKKLEEWHNKYNPGGQEPEEDMWEKMGIQRPDLGDEEEPKHPEMVLEDSDFEYEEGYALVKPGSIDMIVSTETGSEVYLESGKSVTVKETPEEVEGMIRNVPG